MKLVESLHPKRLIPTNRRGVALVTVLTVMALTTILILTFFSLATSEHKASFTYSNGLQAQQVAEQAVNMVIAQIREATLVESGNSPIVWSSQPGAIRVWDEKGNKKNAYKLYSDDLMKIGGQWDEFAGDFDDLKGWDSRPEHFVDLNEPVIRGKKVYYPIVNPVAAVEPVWKKPFGDGKAGVEGFRYNQDGMVLSDEGPMGVKATKALKDDNHPVSGHVAMPVRWIYQLADGTMGILSDSSSGGANGGYRFQAISGSGTPSARNPMVARFAFWADDETSKLNINTHAGGLAWDIPKAGGDLDMMMGKFQPAQNEWQRYPGHPATTHLIPALAPGVIDIVNDKRAMAMLFNIVPRVVGGGSESGTRIINTRDPKEMDGLIKDSDPLFPSLDDMIMRPDRKPHEFPDEKGRPVDADKLSEHLEQRKFFLTANSRAPETNLFNKPRIAMWPIYAADPSDSDYENRLTKFDQLIRFCASMGVNPGGGYPRYEYIFKRKKADSPTYDYDDIPRNQELYDYLLKMMESEVPGYGGSFKDKYGDKNARQLITMIFDYIRSTNLHDDTLFKGEDFKKAFQKDNTSNHVTYTNPRDENEKGFGHKGHGQVTPIRIGETKGMGRFFTISGADIHVICAGQYGGLPESYSALYPGVDQYNRGEIERPAGNLYTNLPPLPASVDPANDTTWPVWLRNLRDNGPAEEFQAAFDPAQWNWQLVFLDDSYRDAVLADPNANKFKRPELGQCENMRLQEGEVLVQAAFLFNMFCPSIGWGSINPDMEVRIKKESGMRFDSTGSVASVGFLGFEGEGYLQKWGPVDDDIYIWATNWAKPHKQGGARSYGGLLPFGYTMTARQALQEDGVGGDAKRGVWSQMAKDGATINSRIRCRLTPLDKGYGGSAIEDALGKVNRNVLGDKSKIHQAYRYDLVTVPFKVGSAGPAWPNLSFDGGKVNFKVYNGGEYCEGSASDTAGVELIQEVEMDFPPFNVEAPRIGPGFKGYIDERTRFSHDSHNGLELASLTADPANPTTTSKSKASRRAGVGRPGSGIRADDEGKFLANIGRMALLTNHWDSGATYVRTGDVVRSIAIPHGDARIAAAMPKITPADGVFEPHRRYNEVGSPYAHSLTNAAGTPITGFTPSGDRDYLIIPDLPTKDARNRSANPYRGTAVPMAFARDKSKDVQLYGDFDNGSGLMIDGPYINKPDEGNVQSLRSRFTQEVASLWDKERSESGEPYPYFTNPDLAEAGGPAYFSPNRIVSGPGMFGSLPTGLFPKASGGKPHPWQTLLFRPNVAGGKFPTHPGAADPPDHFIMDLFWMPVVEPYAISEPLSTAGKINLNFEIVPFLHVHRDTALRGVFRSEYMLCIPNKWHADYKHGFGRGYDYHWLTRPNGGDLQGKQLRTVILDDKTLEQFLTKFDKGQDLFKSSSEICEIHLIPQEIAERIGKPSAGVQSYTPTVDQMRNGQYWSDHSLVGDNSRERPYTNIQARLTTKSNTFQVHYRAQVLRQSRRENDADYGEWRPMVDSVQAEYRGSSIVERYVDPNGEMEDFAKPNAKSIDGYYRFRVINPRRFAP